MIWKFPRLVLGLTIGLLILSVVFPIIAIGITYGTAEIAFSFGRVLGASWMNRTVQKVKIR